MGAKNSTVRESNTDSRESYDKNESMTETTIDRRIRRVDHSSLLWLKDTITDVSPIEQVSFINRVQRLFHHTHIYTDVDVCLNYLRQIDQDEQVFMIIPVSMVKSLVPNIHHMSQLDSIFLYSNNKNISNDKQWLKDWPKIHGVFSQITLIYEPLRQAVEQCERRDVPIIFINHPTTSTGNRDQLDPSFMYTQLLKEILLSIDYDHEKCIKALSDYCRERKRDSMEINKFENEYKLQTPIWWYTYECFLYPMLNRALRTLDIDVILKTGFFIQDLHRQIEQLHAEQIIESKLPFTVYRGQSLTAEDFEKLKNSKGRLLAFNNFLSTSKNRQVSYGFAYASRANPDLLGILFDMTIDPNVSSAPFALLDKVSYCPSEQEILFSMQTVFRIIEIEPLDGKDRFWQVKLVLTSDHDSELSELLRWMRDETAGATGWERLGELMIKLGVYDKADEINKTLLEQTSDDEQKLNIYHRLGEIKQSQGEYDRALWYYEENLRLTQRICPPDHLHFAASYTGLAIVYFYLNDYPKALMYHEKALAIRQKELPSDHPDTAASYHNIGAMHMHMNQYEKAIAAYEKALEIRRKSLPPNHPDMASTFNNIANIYYRMGDYSQALSFYHESLEIKKRIYSYHQPAMAVGYHNIGCVYKDMGDLENARNFYERAVRIGECCLPSGHPTLATYRQHLNFVKSISSSTSSS